MMHLRDLMMNEGAAKRTLLLQALVDTSKQTAESEYERTSGIGTYEEDRNQKILQQRAQALERIHGNTCEVWLLWNLVDRSEKIAPLCVVNGRNGL